MRSSGSECTQNLRPGLAMSPKPVSGQPKACRQTGQGEQNRLCRRQSFRQPQCCRRNAFYGRNGNCRLCTESGRSVESAARAQRHDHFDRRVCAQAVREFSMVSGRRQAVSFQQSGVSGRLSPAAGIRGFRQYSRSLSTSTIVRSQPGHFTTVPTIDVQKSALQL